MPEGPARDAPGQGTQSAEGMRSGTQAAGGHPPASPGGEGMARGTEFASRFGLPTATALVVGSIVGTGVFALPTALTPYGYHPMFAEADFVTCYGNDDASHLPAIAEGGDVHVLGHGAVLIGLGERTTAMAVEILARASRTQGADRPAADPAAAGSRRHRNLRRRGNPRGEGWRRAVAGR